MARSARTRKHRPPPGSPPGTLATDPGAPPPPVRVIAFGPDRFEEKAEATLEEAAKALGKFPVTWVDIDGVGHEETLTAVARLIGLHPLALADVADTHQRPKVEDYGSYLFIVLRLPHSSPTGAPAAPGPGAAGDEPLQTEQVSMVLSANAVITFQEEARPGDCFAPVRHRLRTASGQIRSLGADYLAYALIDAVIDAYFPLLERVGERLDTLESESLQNPEPALIQDLHRVRRDLLTVRRATWPLRDALSGLVRDQTRLVGAETRVFLRDCYDHTVQILDLVESYREIGSALMEVHFTTISNRLNETIRVLTIISTLFIPLTFIVGVYGMNFNPAAGPLNMPELDWPYGYVAVWLVMITVAAVMLWAFRRRGWIGRKRAPHGGGASRRPPAS